jgi:hypothetical protein
MLTSVNNNKRGFCTACKTVPAFSQQTSQQADFDQRGSPHAALQRSVWDPMADGEGGNHPVQVQRPLFDHLSPQTLFTYQGLSPDTH